MRRGFTGHEMLMEVMGGLIHMNGRIYDPNLGRFMTADPTVQFAGFSQSYNRYSYILNSPLNGTDPSGYSWANPFGSEWRDLVGAGKGVLQNPFSVNSWNGLNHSLIGHGTIDNYILTHSWANALAHTVGSVVSLWCWRRGVCRRH